MSLWLSADELIELTGYRQREPLLQRFRGRFATGVQA